MYQVSRLQYPTPNWTLVIPISIENIMGDKPTFIPQTEFRLQYDEEFIYGMVKVKDRYVRSVITEINGPVSDDSCIEFFFAPNEREPLHYFNLEINAGGTPLMFFIKHPWSDFVAIDPEDIKQVEILHSLPQQVEPEFEEEINWQIEFKIPYSLLRKYSAISEPKPGLKWRANFYKTATNTSNPHYITWNKVEFAKPNFHLPEFFGELEFE